MEKNIYKTQIKNKNKTPQKKQRKRREDIKKGERNKHKHLGFGLVHALFTKRSSRFRSSSTNTNTKHNNTTSSLFQIHRNPLLLHRPISSSRLQSSQTNRPSPIAPGPFHAPPSSSSSLLIPRFLLPFPSQSTFFSV